MTAPTAFASFEEETTMLDDRTGLAVEIFDPRGVVDTDSRPLAARKPALAGLRLGILDNSKWNANKLLRGAAAALSDQIELGAVNYYVKTHGFSTDAPAEMIRQIAAENDIVLTAIGDCGSCCSCCIRDAIALEGLGLPTAPIITTEFVNETRLTRTAVGMPELKPVVIDHPVSSITAEEVAARVEVIATQAQEVWLGTRADI
ncbi:MAG: UGSC family (seleno)protein [Pseudomonadota bacterium]